MKPFVAVSTEHDQTEHSNQLEEVGFNILGFSRMNNNYWSFSPLNGN